MIKQGISGDVGDDDWGRVILVMLLLDLKDFYWVIGTDSD
jgi:hypothetical protein